MNIGSRWWRIRLWVIRLLQGRQGLISRVNFDPPDGKSAFVLSDNGPVTINECNFTGPWVKLQEAVND